jgi:hypothetical protein
MRKPALIYWLLPVLFSAACHKQDINATTPAYDLIVEGGINSLYKQQYIRLTKPARASDRTIQPVSSAVVSVNDGTSDIVFNEIAGTGVYTAVVDNNNNYDDPYTLHITYQGNEYEASDFMTSIVPIDESYIPLTTRQDNGFIVTIPKHIFGVSTAQQWLIAPAGSSWNPSKFDTNYNFNYSHVFGTPNALNPLIQQKRILHTGLTDSLKIYKYSISLAYSTFLYNLFQETDWKGVLSSTPSNVKGNISGKANGYFYAIAVDTITAAVKDINK